MELNDQCDAGTTDPPESDVGQINVSCPRCARPLAGFVDRCPHCSADLPFGVILTNAGTPLTKAAAWVFLILFLGSILVLFGMIVIRNFAAAGQA